MLKYKREGAESPTINNSYKKFKLDNFEYAL